MSYKIVITQYMHTTH